MDGSWIEFMLFKLMMSMITIIILMLVLMVIMMITTIAMFVASFMFRSIRIMIAISATALRATA